MKKYIFDIPEELALLNNYKFNDKYKTASY